MYRNDIKVLSISYISNTISLPIVICVSCMEAVYRHVTVELLASFQWMKSNHDTNFFKVTFIQEHVFMGLAAG